MVQTKIVEEDKFLLESFDEQINKVINEIEELNEYTKVFNLRVMNECKVIVLYLSE
ncbi:hypothetical protein [Staphylococcus saprophyticus]|uniref:hypothetical protein n=1 Tax=Staphylococcus saprophyticus TaxID=29385 RepID=UPI0015D660DA|nr:hypothetical protein [Staphylococcus saprophyticus]